MCLVASPRYWCFAEAQRCAQLARAARQVYEVTRASHGDAETAADVLVKTPKGAGKLKCVGCAFFFLIFKPFFCSAQPAVLVTVVLVLVLVDSARVQL